ncbi:MAG: hypothetical protein ACLP9S_10885 [Syntrophales bacterium]|jgi:hypothetical protein
MLKFNSETHLYTWNGSPVPSVTQVIGTWTKIAVGTREYYYSPYTGDIVEPDIMEKASDWGIAVHQVVAIVLSGDDIYETEAPPEHMEVRNEVRKWQDIYKPEIVSIEQPCYSAGCRYAGTPDIVCRIGVSEGIVDIKTGRSETVGIQTAAYCQMVYGGYVRRWLMKIYTPRGPMCGCIIVEIRGLYQTTKDMFIEHMLFRYSINSN